ncbi:transposase [Streptomyces sp. V4I23]|nr:transposase [Streptomyces sp. V4I23]
MNDADRATIVERLQHGCSPHAIHAILGVEPRSVGVRSSSVAAVSVKASALTRVSGNWRKGRAGMMRAYKFLLRPTAGQEASLRAMLADHCSLYNGALQERRDAYRHVSKTSIEYGDQSAQLKEIRAFHPERQGRWSFSSQQATLRQLDKAFQAFFGRIKAGEKPGYPRFKGAGYFDTVMFPKDGDGCRWNSTPHDRQTRVRLQGVGHIRVHQHRPVKGRAKTISVKREGRRWYVILACDEVPPAPLPATGSIVGIDMGVTHFLTTSQGEHVVNPRLLEQSAEALAAAQQHRSNSPSAWSPEPAPWSP